MSDHIGKPFELTDLVQCLLRHTGRKPVETQQDAPGSGNRAPALPAQATALAQQAGVDVVAAVSRLGGQVGVYERMLRGFLRDLPALMLRLDDALGAAAHVQAATEMHTLKGLAGTLGVSGLQADSAEAERHLRGGASSREAEQHAARVRQHLQRLCAVGPMLATALLAPEVGARVQSAPELTSAELQNRLRTLEALLRRSDMGASELLERMRAPLAEALGDRFNALDHAVQALQFDRAAQICSGLLLDGPVAAAGHGAQDR